MPALNPAEVKAVARTCALPPDYDRDEVDRLVDWQLGLDPEHPMHVCPNCRCQWHAESLTCPTCGMRPR